MQISRASPIWHGLCMRSMFCVLLNLYLHARFGWTIFISVTAWETWKMRMKEADEYTFSTGIWSLAVRLPMPWFWLLNLHFGFRHVNSTNMHKRSFHVIEIFVFFLIVDWMWICFCFVAFFLWYPSSLLWLTLLELEWKKKKKIPCSLVEGTDTYHLLNTRFLFTFSH